MLKKGKATMIRQDVLLFVCGMAFIVALIAVMFGIGKYPNFRRRCAKDFDWYT